jgi:carbamate kinase
VRIVIALGGNALLKRGEPLEAALQLENVRRAARALAPVARRHQVIVTHGNGPQVGLLALQSEAYAGTRPYPLDVLGAETQGMIGYMIEDELREALGDEREVAALLTQVVVDEDDPAFAAPGKPVGPVYAEGEARAHAASKGWTVGPDGRGWRRLVASPEPRRIVEINSIRLLVDAGVITICAGGGGVPVVAGASGKRHGVEAVIDKDLCAALLASQLDARALVLLTDADAVYDKWGTPGATPIRRTTPSALRRMSFARGSMGPKVEAACRFVEGGDGARFAAIGALSDVEALLQGETGTTVEGD